MKYKIRFNEEYVVRQCNETAILDSEDFRNLSNNPYTGNSDKEFFEYIQSFLEDDANKEGISDAIIDELNKLEFGADAEVYYDSRDKTCDTWIIFGPQDGDFTMSSKS
jgi:hypothetical protein